MRELNFFKVNAEYFCKNCGQFRGTYLTNPKSCNKCGSLKIIVGKPGELNRDELKRNFADSKSIV